MPVLARPDHIFEAAFFSNDDGPIWANLTDYIELQEGIAVGKRRQNVFDEVAPVTLSAYLDNSPGTFNNDKAASPFAGCVNLDVPVRFRLRWPVVPAGTANMLSDAQSVGSDPSQFTADMGSTDTDTASAPAGQASDLIWSTGVLDQAGACVMTGAGPTRSPDSEPVYVKGSTTYSARAQVKDDSAGTGISFQASIRMRWFDIDGTQLSETSSAPLTLTTAYQSLSVTGASPASAASVRVGVFNETIVGPTARAIYWDGGDSQCTNWGKSRSVTIPSTANVGDVALAWIRVNNSAVTITLPAGFTSKTSWSDSKGKTQLAYKVVAASDIGKRYVFAMSANCGSQAFLTCYGGVSQASPIHQWATAAESVFRTTHTTPNVTTTIANCWIVSAAFDVSSTTTSWSAPGGEQVRNTGYRTGGNSPTGIATDNGAAVIAGTYGSKVFTANASSRYASMATVALGPAAGTGPGNVNVQIGKLELVQGSLGVWAQGGHWESKFTGAVDSWSEVFSGELTLMQVAATDRQKQLKSVSIGSAVSEAIASAGPVAYYRLDESDSGTGSTQEAANYSDISQDTLKPKQFGSGGVINWGQGTGPAVDGTSALMLAPADTSNGVALYSLLADPLVNTNAVTLTCFFNSAATSANNRTIMKLQAPTSGAKERGYVEIRSDTSNHIQANASIASESLSYQATATSANTYFDGKTHCLAATFQVTGGQLVSTLYIDGAYISQATAGASVAQWPTLSAISVGCAASAAYICAGNTAFSGDTIDQRIGRLCDWEGQDSLSLQPTETICARHMPDAQALLDAIQQAARSEGGTAYIDGDGNITFLSRQGKEQTSAPLLTIKASMFDPGSFAKVTDDELLVNKAVIKRLDTGVNTTALDAASRDTHGLHEKPIDTILSANADALDYATYLLAFYSEPQARCNQVTFSALLLQDWADVLLVDMWQILRITSLPSAEQNSTLDLYIEGWELKIDHNNWLVTFDTSTAIPFGILDDATRGVCGASVVGW